jgi:hypothetical protein
MGHLTYTALDVTLRLKERRGLAPMNFDPMLK